MKPMREIDNRFDNERRANADATSVDPVCGMTVNSAGAAGSYEYKGQTYYFCSVHCLDKFRENPEQFLNKPEEPELTHPIGIQREMKPIGAQVTQSYTCPMHPEDAAGPARLMSEVRHGAGADKCHSASAKN